MPCLEGIDPGDFESGIVDPVTDPVPLVSEVTIDDATSVRDPDGTYWCRFQINITNINYNDDIQFNYATANGTGSAGTHYSSASGLFTIPAGESGGVIEVQLVAAAFDTETGSKTFFVNLSNPSNCTIVDSQGKGTINYGSAPPPPDTGGLPVSYTGFPKQACNSGSDSCTIYDQFSDCRYKAACTGYAGAAAMSALYWRATGGVNGGQFKRFNAKKLFADAGGTVCTSCSNCPGWRPARVLKWMRDVGVQIINTSTFKKISAYSAISYSSRTELVRKIKENIQANGCIYLVSKFYSSPNNGWNRCKDCNDLVLRNWDKNGPYGSASSGCNWTNANLVDSGVGHTWILTGWNDNKASGGAFEIQSSHGDDWGAGGRCWIPYSFLVLNNSHWEYYKVVYGG